MKKYLKIGLCLLLTAAVAFTAVFFASATADSRDIHYNDEYIYEVLPDDTVTIHCYIGNASQVTVPSLIDALPVVSVERLAFYGTSVKNVILSEGITTLKDEAFFYSIGLESVTLPSTLSEVGQGVFRDCLNLRSVVFSEEASAMGEFMFYGCSSLNSISLADSLTEIPSGAFSYCRSLSEIVLPEELDTINEYAFYGSGLESVTLPLKLQNIHSKAFAESTMLAEIVLLNTKYDFVAADAFENCKAEFPYYNTDPSATEFPTAAEPTSSSAETTISPESPSMNVDMTEGDASSGEMPPQIVPPSFENTDPTETTETVPADTAEPFSSEPVPSSSDIPSETTEYIQAGDYYIGDSQGFLLYESSKITEAGALARGNRSELFELAWNVRTAGDSNNDGKVNVRDATRIQRYAAGLITADDPDFNYKNSDVDTDGKVSVKDATRIQKYVAGIIVSLS